MAALIRPKSDTESDRDEIPAGTLYLLILKTLAVGRRLHGYEIAESIQNCSDEVLQVEEGSLYPALQRMLIKGWVTADTHVHFLSPTTALLEGQAEGLNLINLLAAQWGGMDNVDDAARTGQVLAAAAPAAGAGWP